MNQGQRVKTPLGDGTVCYVRMGWTSSKYADITHVSVLLDKKKNNILYSGTLFPIEQITEIENEDDP